MRDHRPFSGTVLFLATAGTFLLLLQVVAREEDNSRVNRVLRRAEKITSEAFNLERKLDARIDPRRIRKAGSLRARVDAISKPTCEDHQYQCGGDDPQCIGELFVCDGETDCRNGEDEKHCVLQLKKGDVFIGDKVFDHCGMLNPEHITVIINSVTTESFFTSHSKLSVTLTIDVDREDEETHVSLPSIAHYSFATHRLVIQPPEGDALFLIGQFDGHNFDRFVGDSASVGSGEPCARYIYRRQH